MGITLGKKQLNKGRVSLYLNYSYNGKRRKEYLGIILDAPTSAERRAENMFNMVFRTFYIHRYISFPLLS